MMLIDTHCHLYLSKYDYDLKEVVERAILKSIKSIKLVTTISVTQIIKNKFINLPYGLRE